MIIVGIKNVSPKKTWRCDFCGSDIDSDYSYITYREPNKLSAIKVHHKCLSVANSVNMLKDNITTMPNVYWYNKKMSAWLKDWCKRNNTKINQAVSGYTLTELCHSFIKTYKKPVITEDIDLYASTMLDVLILVDMVSRYVEDLLIASNKQNKALQKDIMQSIDISLSEAERALTCLNSTEIGWLVDSS